MPQWELKIGTAIIAAMLALAAALAAACYVRAFGIAFLGRARSPGAAAAREVEPTMLAAMVGLAAICLVLGVLPATAFALIQPVADQILGPQPAANAGGGAWLWLTPPAAGGNSYSGLIVLVVVAFFASLTVLGIHHLASRRVRRSIPWGCGYGESVPAAQYSASSFGQPLRRVFASVLGAGAGRVELEGRLVAAYAPAGRKVVETAMAPEVVAGALEAMSALAAHAEAGRFDVDPRICDEWCGFRSVCRYVRPPTEEEDEHG